MTAISDWNGMDIRHQSKAYFQGGRVSVGSGDLSLGYESIFRQFIGGSPGHE